MTLLAAALVASGIALGADVKVALTGAQEVPAVKTAASGTGTITVGDDPDGEIRAQLKPS